MTVGELGRLDRRVVELRASLKPKNVPRHQKTKATFDVNWDWRP